MSAVRQAALRAGLLCVRGKCHASAPWVTAASQHLLQSSSSGAQQQGYNLWQLNDHTRWRSTTAAPPTDDSISSLMDGLSAAKLRDQLEGHAETSPFMTYKQLLDFIRSHGAADTEQEAHERADALQRAGIILRFNGVVYLRPQEVSELVFRALPTNPTSAVKEVAEVEAELATMDAKFKSIQASAKRWPRFWTTTGCVVLFGQLVGFVYLTWWELSWDVMEPVAYILGLTYSFMAYVYFLITRGAYLDYGPFQEYWTEQLLKKRMSQRGFDMERYQHLMRTRERYARYIQAQADAPPLKAGAAAAEESTQ